VIAKMKKVFLVARASQREALLERLRDLGVVHLEPVDAAASAPEDLRSRLRDAQRALQVLATVQAAGQAPELPAAEAVAEVLAVRRRMEENRNRLSALAREAQRLAVWGELRRELLDALTEAGVPVRFYSVPAAEVGQVAAECVATLGELPGKRALVAVIQRAGEPTLPEDSQELQPPPRDLPSVRASSRSGTA